MAPVIPKFKTRTTIGPNGPTVPHIATVIDDSGQLLPLVPGMAFFIVEDPEKPMETLPFTLVSVSKHRIVLRLKGAEGAIYDYPFINNTKVLANNAAVKAHKRNGN